MIVSGILLTFGIEYERYFNGAQFIHFLLGPATVALAIPIYNQIKLIQKEALSITITLITGSLFAIFITYYLAKSFGLDK